MSAAAVPGWPCGVRMQVVNGVGIHTWVAPDDGYIYVRRVTLDVQWAGPSTWGMNFDDGAGASPPVQWARTSPWAGSTTPTDETWLSPAWHPSGGDDDPPDPAWTSFPTSPGVWVEPPIMGGNEGSIAVIGGNTYALTGVFVPSGEVAIDGYNGSIDFMFSPKPPEEFLVAEDDDCAAPASPPGVIVKVDGVVMEGLIEKQCRVALNDPGSFSFRIPKDHEQATAAILHPGAVVEFTFPEIHDDPIFEGLLETGDFVLLDTAEEGAEELTFGGPGSLGILDRARVHFNPEYDTGDAPATVVKRAEGVWRWVNQEPGDILERLIEEAIARGVLAGVTYTFDDNEDSAGVPWSGPGPWIENIGAPLYEAAMRLVAAGKMNLVMRPGLVLDAFQTIGSDRSSSTFEADKVRFVKAVNVVDEVGRSMAGIAAATHALVHGDDGSWMEIVKDGFDPDVDVYREITVEVNAHDAATMESAGVHALAAREDAQEALIFGVRIPYPGTATDELSGIYLPGPSWSARGQFWPGDLVTLYTGTGEFDYDNATFRVYAISLREDSTGHLGTPVVELNSPWIDPDDDSTAGEDPVPIAGGGSGGVVGGGNGGDSSPHTHGIYQVADLDRWKQPVRVATTANITISTGLNAGDTIDGVTLADGDRVLVKDQSTGSQNGIYQVGAAPTRTSDFDASDEVVGAVVYVTAGTANGGKAFRSTNATPPTIGSTALTFDEFGTATIPAGTYELADEGGQSVISAHGSMGSTETFDPSDGNVHTGTLTADCAFTLNAPTGSGACVLEFWLTQDGTGGWDITWPGSVTLQGTLDTTADTTSRVIVESIDGGTSWVATVIGGAAVGALDDLSDVTITTPAEDDTLRYIGGEWVNDNRRWEPVTHNPGTGPEIVFDGDDIVMTWRTY